MKALKTILLLCTYSFACLALAHNDDSDFIIQIQPKSSTGALRNRNLLRRMEKSDNKIIVRQGFVDVKHSNKLSKRRPDILLVQFFDTDELTVFLRTMDWDDESGFYWFGENEETESSLNIQVHDNKYTGYAEISGKVYSIMTEFDGLILAQEVNVANLPDEADDGHGYQDYNGYEEADQNPTGNRSLAKGSSFPDSGDSIDILCLYTQQALMGICRTMMGNDCFYNYMNYIPAMNDKCQFVVHQTNMIFALSGVETKVNLVHSDLIDSNYVEDDDMCRMVHAMKSSNQQPFQHLRQLREQYRADLVSLMVDNDTYCGCGSFFSGAGGYDPNQAFFVVNTYCSTSQHSFTHELGHAFGCNHNRFAYGHPFGNGWRDPESEFRTVMSYQCNNKNCPRIQRISSSNTGIRYNGKPVGNALHDNARLINERKIYIANYRNSDENVPIESLISAQTTGSGSNCQWDESLLEINLVTDNKEGRIEWSITKDGEVIDSLSMNHNANSNIKYRQCVSAGVCYNLTINDADGKGTGASIQVTENGELVIDSNSIKKIGQSFPVPVDGTMKHNIGWPGMNKLECSWLTTQSKWKLNQECSKKYIKSVCPRVCSAC